MFAQTIKPAAPSESTGRGSQRRTESSPIRVVVAESSTPIRQFLAGTVDAADGLEMVAICSNADELRAALAESPADVVVTDVRMPPDAREEGIRIARRLRAEGSHTGVLVLSQYAEPTYVLSVVESGPARAYVLKERISNRAELIAAIEAVARGGVFVDLLVVEALIEARTRVARSPLPRLTAGEEQLLAQIGTGKSDAQIAHRLSASEPAIAARAKAILEKIGVPHTDEVCERVRRTLAYLADEG